jgi:hypothetical protein
MAERVTWSSPDGLTIDLTDEAAGYSILANGTRGLTSVSYDMIADRQAGLDGATVQAVYAAPNEPTLGIMIRADGDADLRAKVRGLVRAMRPKAGQGTLTVTDEQGATRRLGCYCMSGTEGDESPDTTLAGAWWKAALKFYAPDPWWYGPQIAATWSLVDLPAFFPIFPMRLSASTIRGERTITNPGDEDAYPRWTITGPGTGLELVNRTTGRSIALDITLTAGDAVHIDTRPGYQSVRAADGTNLFGTVASDPALWALEPGPNTVAVLMDDVGPTSSVSGYFAPRYSGI